MVADFLIVRQGIYHLGEQNLIRDIPEDMFRPRLDTNINPTSLRTLGGSEPVEFEIKRIGSVDDFVIEAGNILLERGQGVAEKTGATAFTIGGIQLRLGQDTKYDPKYPSVEFIHHGYQDVKVTALLQMYVYEEKQLPLF